MVGKTSSADFVFTVKEAEDGKPFIALEPRGPQFSGQGFPAGSFFLDLRRETTIEQALVVARVCNRYVEGISFTAQSRADQGKGSRKGPRKWATGDDSEFD